MIHGGKSVWVMQLVVPGFVCTIGNMDLFTVRKCANVVGGSMRYRPNGARSLSA